MESNETLALVYKGVGRIEPMTVPIPRIPGPAVRVEMKACGICGSDVKYFQGDNPWALHTLGRNIPPPPNMVLGHEVSGVEISSGQRRRVAILAFKSCGRCAACRDGRENLCADMEHFGHSAGWPPMEYTPGGMSRVFEIWQGFDYTIPDSVSHEAATFLDGLAVAVHAVEMGGVAPGAWVGVVGLGPIGMLAAQAARAAGAERVFASDIYDVPVRLAREVGLVNVVCARDTDPVDYMRSQARGRAGLDVVFDTVGSEESITRGLGLLAPGGALVLLAISEKPVHLATIAISGERRIVSSANNRYPDFPRAIELLAQGLVRVEPLITHRFRLEDGPRAFEVMLHKEEEGAYKVVLLP
jgi:2-desacetyl-2-hydroxyethyl bacteriochlorophyllide A dehydrogenase